MTGEIADQIPDGAPELVDWYDKNFNRAMNRVRAITSEQLTTPVDFLGAFNFPAVLYLSFVNKHSIHHRGQLSVYRWVRRFHQFTVAAPTNRGQDRSKLPSNGSEGCPQGSPLLLARIRSLASYHSAVSVKLLLLLC